MSLRRYIYRRLILPTLQRSTYQGLAQRWQFYKDLERQPLQQNLERQKIALKRLLQDAYDHVPFYRRRFDEAGFHPQNFRNVDDLRVIPYLTRDDLRNNFDTLKSSLYEEAGMPRAATGGTTSNPVPFLRTTESVLEKNALQLRFDAWAGLEPGDKIFYIWGALQDFPQKPSWRWRLYDYHLMRRLYAPTSLFNDDVLEYYRQQMCEFRPHAIYAYPTPLALFCEYLKQSGKPFPSVNSVICTAEPLFAAQRSIIESVLGCRVFEQYGSREFGMIGGECEVHAGLHINPLAALVEFVPVENAAADLHEVIVTDLLNFGMPLIRYSIGDCAVPVDAPCSCGRGYPRIGQLAGRTTDVFYLPDGSKVPGVSLTNRVVKEIPGVEQMQVIQEELDHVQINYVPGTTFSAADLDFLTAKLRNFFPPSVRLTFQKVDRIEREPSGKTRFCICRIPGLAADSATPQAQER